jgi:hypothetical protein
MEGREIVEFQPGQPVQVALAYASGKFVSGIRGERVMFTLADGRLMFLDKGPAQQINELGVKPREPFFVAKYRRGNQVEWQAWLAPEGEKQRALEGARAAGDSWTARKLEQSIERSRTVAGVIGALPTLEETNSPAPAPRSVKAAAAARPTATGPANPLRASSVSLLCDVRQMIDVYGDCLTHAKQQHGGSVKPLHVLAMLLAAFMKGGRK